MAQSLKTKLKINSSAANSVDKDEDADSSWQLSAFDLQRSPHHIISDPNSTICITPKHFEEFKCPVCLDLLENTLTAMECLHRFCAACISSALRSGNKECPTCRTKLVSKRSLRPDPNFDALIGVLFPDRNAVNNYQLQMVRSSSSHAAHSVGATKALADSANHMQDEVSTAVTESTKRLGREMEEGMRKQAELSAPFIKRKRPNFSASAANTPRDNSGSVLENDESIVHGADFAADNAEEEIGDSPHAKPPATLSAPQQLKLRCRYGNYPSYYGYRNRYLADSRLECMDAEWFQGKRVLDIGCNSGVVTYQIAQKFSPRSVIGIDIDRKLIESAKFNVRYYVDKQSCNSCLYPTSCVLEAGPCAISPPQARKAEHAGSTETEEEDFSAFPLNISFIAGNYVLENDQILSEYCSKRKQQPISAAGDSPVVDAGNFDVILALSVTKWIHVNWGDAGVQRLFKRAFEDLKSGGIFILEPQEWKSYEKSKKDRKLEQDQVSTLREINFKPDAFVDYLCSHVGFQLMTPVGQKESGPMTPHHAAKGFQRPIHIFRKPE